MLVEELALSDFRNYERASVEFAGGVNLIVGSNAQGKTNLLEAVHVLGGLGSPRGAEAPLVRTGAERAVLNARVARDDRRVAIDLEFAESGRSRALVNKTPVRGLRPLRELVTTVFFGPDELGLVKGSPDGRRRFLDELVVKLRPVQDGLRRDFDRVLRQRNALLKSSSRSAESLAVWDETFCRTGAELAAARLQAMAGLQPHATKRYEQIAGGGRLKLGYKASWLTRDPPESFVEAVDVETLRRALEAAVQRMRVRELERGASLVGPQRDDLEMMLMPASDPVGAPRPARVFASQGDQRSCALAVKLGEHDLLTDVTGSRPILLLDDVFSELDPARRVWLGDAVRGAGQVVISSAEPGAVESAKPERVFEVAGGEVRMSG